MVKRSQELRRLAVAAFAALNLQLALGVVFRNPLGVLQIQDVCFFSLLLAASENVQAQKGELLCLEVGNLGCEAAILPPDWG